MKKHAFDTIIMEDTKMIKAGIIGATGYAGNEIVRLLLGHKNVEVAWYGSRSYVDQKYASVYQNMFQIVEDVRSFSTPSNAASSLLPVVSRTFPESVCNSPAASFASCTQ